MLCLRRYLQILTRIVKSDRMSYTWVPWDHCENFQKKKSNGKEFSKFLSTLLLNRINITKKNLNTTWLNLRYNGYITYVFLFFKLFSFDKLITPPQEKPFLGNNSAEKYSSEISKKGTDAAWWDLNLSIKNSSTMNNSTVILKKKRKNNQK